MCDVRQGRGLPARAGVPVEPVPVGPLNPELYRSGAAALDMGVGALLCQCCSTELGFWL